MANYVSNVTMPNGTNVLIKDNECRTSLANEIKRATDKELSLKNDIDDEMSRAMDAEDSILTKISDSIIVLGDSYGTGYTTNGNITSWCDYVKNKLEKNNYSVVTNSKYGCGFSQVNNTWTDLLKLTTVKDKDSVKKIIIGGGYNDHGANFETVVKPEINNLCEYVKNNFKNAKVIYYIFGNKFGDNAVNLELSVQKKNLEENINDIFFVDSDSYYILAQENEFTSDKVHPNDKGQKHISQYVCNSITGLSYDSEVTDLINVTVNEIPYNLISRKNNGVVTLWFSRERLDKEITFSFGKEYNIMLPENVPCRYLIGYCQTTLIARVKATGAYLMIPCDVLIRSKTLTFKFNALNNKASSFSEDKVLDAFVPQNFVITGQLR